MLWLIYGSFYLYRTCLLDLPYFVLYCKQYVHYRSFGQNLQLSEVCGLVLLFKSSMPKKRKDALPKSSPVSRETAHTVVAIFSLVLSVFLLLGAFGTAGKVGSGVFEMFSYFFGVGYYLLPITFLLLSISLIHERESGLAMPQILGSLVLLISSLGFVDLASDKGGVMGALISEPLINLFDIYISMVLLLSLAVASFIVIFDVPLKLNLKRLFGNGGLEKDGMVNAETDRAVTEALDKIGITPEDSVRRSEIRPAAKTEDDSFTPIRRRGKASHMWKPPPLSLLERDSGKPGVGDIKANANLIKRTFLNFGIMVEMDEISIGPSVTRYALKPAEGVKLSKILGLQNNLELALAAHPVRIEAPIPGNRSFNA